VAKFTLPKHGRRNVHVLCGKAPPAAGLGHLMCGVQRKTPARTGGAPRTIMNDVEARSNPLVAALTYPNEPIVEVPVA
jgi:hypothetical protein